MQKFSQHKETYWGSFLEHGRQQQYLCHKILKARQPDHVSSYLKAADGRDVLPLFFLELVTGLRKGELVALLWSDLNLEHQTLSGSKQIWTATDHPP